MGMLSGSEEEDHDENCRLYPVGRSPDGGVIGSGGWAGLDALLDVGVMVFASHSMVRVT